MLGVQVCLYTKEKLFSGDIYGGRCDYQQKEIRLDVPEARDALMNLAHEGGHWLSYLLLRSDENSDYDTETRELLAFNFGYHLLESLEAPISSNDWIQFHQDEQDIIFTRERDKN